jgi:hypothetical protein
MGQLRPEPTRLLLLLVLSAMPCVVRADEVQTSALKPVSDQDVPFPPRLPGDVAKLTDTSSEFLAPHAHLKSEVSVAKTAPTVDFLYYPGQNYPGKPWSNWGQSIAAGGKYFSAIGDHLSIREPDAQEHSADAAHVARTGNAFVYEYDPAAMRFRQLADVARVLNLPAGHYTPGKIHGRLDLGKDGALYFATHRGSERAANDRNHYLGDWILRVDPTSQTSEIIAHAPVPKHSIPTSILDGERIIFYGATAAGPDATERGIHFFAVDLQNRKLLYSGPDGPSRALILAQSTGRVYFAPGADEGTLMRFDPAQPSAPRPVANTKIGIRAATRETPDGYAYTVSSGQNAADAMLWSFNTRTEEIEQLGSAAVGTEAYIASIDTDQAGRYLYYVPGAHGSAPRDGSPLVQFDVRTKTKKVIAFLSPFYERKYGFSLRGTYAVAVDPSGDKVFITWNVSRGTRAWDCCGLTVVHIPESERHQDIRQPD